MIDIDLDAIQENVRLLKKRAGDNTAFMAVVKADAYGHGATMVAKAAVEAGAEWLGVANINEGFVLRGSGIDVPILVLSEPEPTAKKVSFLLEADLTPVVYSREFINEYAKRSSIGAPVHLKVDTGMHRLGCNIEDAVGLSELITERGLALGGVMSHLGAANSDLKGTMAQFQWFDQIISRVSEELTISHILNTWGLLNYPRVQYGMVRCGLGMYGLAGGEFGLRPAMSMTSRLSFTRWLPAGACVGYDHVYKLERDGYIGVIPVGYADGVPRSLAGVGWVKIGDWKFPIVSVCMDMLMVDLGRFVMPVGEPVELMGRGIPVSNWVSWLKDCGYNEYEIACGMGRRGRRYEDGKYSGDTAVT